MAVRGFDSLEILNPRGMWSVLAERRKGNPSRASLMQNYRIWQGFARTRPGTSSVGVTSAAAVSSLRNWVTPTGDNLVLYMDGLEVQSYDQTTSTNTGIFAEPAGTYAISWADFDIWMYFVGYKFQNTVGTGTSQVQVYNGNGQLDTAFRGPITLTASTATDAGAGNVSIGQHFYGFVYQNRTGFSGVPTTSISGTPLSITTVVDAQKVNISVTLPALTDGGGDSTLFLIATRADNTAAWYFIPTYSLNGSIGEQPVPYNTPVTLNFVFNFSDADMAATLDSALNQFNYVTQDGMGNAPFNVDWVNVYGQRMCYGIGTQVFISNINNPQQGALDQNLIAMPNQRNIVFGFPLPGSTSFYLTGDRWTAYVTDTGDIPVTWAPATTASAAQGASYPELVCFRTKGPYAWIVTQEGPYQFDGAFAQKPLTYLVSDLWDQVNWSAAYAIQIKDDINDLKLYVSVPMHLTFDANGNPTDNPTVCNRQFVIDYQNGLQFNEVDISLDIYNPATFGSIAVVKEINGRESLWFGPSSAGALSHFDATTHNDQGAAVDGFWECGLVTGNRAQQSSMVRFNGADLWLRGNGVPIITIFGLDRTVSFTTPLLVGSGIPAGVLSAAPGIAYITQYDLAAAFNETIRIETNSVDAWSEISGIKPYYRQDLWNR